ncbi:MAG: hypothetical protein QGI83_03050 [Candidatus Latescibacteria bacterium]|jgi:hypothetical protein|nr:hypothetical protein [Candidatus Latescibacterota bacterium]
MDAKSLVGPAADLLRRRMGVVIPVYLPDTVDRTVGESLLRDTVAAYCALVDDPSTVCLTVDGEAFGADVVACLAREAGISTSVSDRNLGKLQTVTHGMRHLPARGSLDYLAVVDQDGDHFANELLNLVRAANHISQTLSTDRILVLGRRISRHRPMGLPRGEIEELCDRVLLDALTYNAAVKQEPLRMEYAFIQEEFPDFHSGYKLFSSQTAEAVFHSEQRTMGTSDVCYYRHAGEAVMAVEAMEDGAYLGVVNRTTFNEQPISTFGQLNRIELAADKIIWPCRRLSIPSPFVVQWMGNHIPRLLLGTLAPEGKEELERIRERVIASLQDDGPFDAGPVFHPLFV